MASARLPGKPLIDIGGRPAIQHVWDACVKSIADRVVVAAEDREIKDAVEVFGGFAVLTDREHHNGTSRCYEVYCRLNEHFDVIVNVQCDEVCVDPDDINTLITELGNDVDCYIATLVSNLLDSQKDDRSVTKAACDETCCYWFSRGSLAGSKAHHGIYAFDARQLQFIVAATPSDNALAEGLEQLTWVEEGYRILPVQTANSVMALNTENDLAQIRNLVEICS